MTSSSTNLNTFQRQSLAVSRVAGALAKGTLWGGGLASVLALLVFLLTLVESVTGEGASLFSLVGITPLVLALALIGTTAVYWMFFSLAKIVALHIAAQN